MTEPTPAATIPAGGPLVDIRLVNAAPVPWIGSGTDDDPTRRPDGYGDVDLLLYGTGVYPMEAFRIPRDYLNEILHGNGSAVVQCRVIDRSVTLHFAPGQQPEIAGVPAINEEGPR